MEKITLLKLSISLALALSSSTLLVAQASNSQDMDTPVFRKRDVQNQIIEKALVVLQSIDRTFEELALAINNGAIKVTDKKFVGTHITKIREFIAQTTAQAEAESIAQCVHINDALLAHLEALLNSNVQIVLPFDTEAVIKKSQDATVDFSQVLERITEHENRIVSLIEKNRKAGKSFIADMFSSTETWLKDKGIWNAGKRVLPYVPFVVYLKYRTQISDTLKRAFAPTSIIIPAPVVDNKEGKEGEKKAEDKSIIIAPNNPIMDSINFKLDTIPFDIGVSAIFTAMLKKDFSDLCSWSNERCKQIYAKVKGESYEDPSPVKISRLSFGDIVGYDHAKGQINHLVEYFANKKMHDRAGTFPDRGYLFVGPLDIGKNLAHGLAGEITKQLKSQGKKCGIRELHSSELVKKDIKDIIADTEKESPYEPAVILIDDISWLAEKSVGDKTTLSSLVGAMSSTLRGNKKQIIIIATSNNPASIDKTLNGAGRLGSTVYFDKPTKEERIAFLTKELKKRSVRIAEFDVEKLAFLTENSSYDILTAIVKTAFSIAASNKEITTQAHLEQAIDGIVHNIAYRDTRRNEEQETILAQYYAAQALAHVLLKPNNQLVKVTILPLSTYNTHAIKHGALITHATDNAQEFVTAEDLQKQITIALAGVKGIKALGGNPTMAMRVETSMLARKLVKEIVFEGILGKEFGKAGQEEKLIAADKLVTQLGQNATDLLAGHTAKLQVLAAELKEKRTLTQQEIMTIINR